MEFRDFRLSVWSLAGLPHFFRPAFFESEDDRWIWAPDEGGNASPSSVYKYISSAAFDQNLDWMDWNHLWKLGVSPMVKVFLWKFLHDICQPELFSSRGGAFYTLVVLFAAPLRTLISTSCLIASMLAVRAEPIWNLLPVHLYTWGSCLWLVL